MTQRLTPSRLATSLLGVLNDTPNGIVVYEPVCDDKGSTTDYRTTYFNTRAQALFGYTEADFATKTLFERFPAGQEIAEKYMPMILNDIPFIQETYFERAQCWVEIQARSLGNGGFFLTLYDITARKKAGEALKTSAVMLQSVLNCVQSGVTSYQAVRNRHGKIIDFRFSSANQLACELMCKPLDELVGNQMNTLFPDCRSSGLFDRYVAAVESGEKQQVVVTFSNVTPAQQLERRLRESNQSLDQFAGIASHDLQEPLRKVQAFGNLLNQQFSPQLGESGQELICRMQRAAERMSVLITDLLAYSRLTSQPENNRLLDLNKIVSEVLTDLETKVADLNAKVTVEPLPAIEANQLAIRQLTQNLLSNALKFARPGVPPEISVTATLVSAKDVQVALPFPKAKAYWCLQVRDNGIGFDTQYKDKIFGAFQRLHNRNSLYSGIGIGLAIVKKVVDQYGGAIDVESTPGEGSLFKVYLPAQAESVQP